MSQATRAFYKGEDVTGTTFGRYRVLGLGRRSGRWRVLCLGCGLEADRNAQRVRENDKGCMACTYKASRASGSVHWKGGRHVPSYFWSKARLTSSRRSRDIPWDITIEDLDIQWERQQGRCAYTGWPLEFGTNSTEQTASLDRRDSSGGYTPDNIQFVHKDVNVMKTDLTEDRFLAICRTITEVAA